MTYAGNISSLEINKRKNINIEKIDIIKSDKISKVIKTFQPDFIFHLAESHVDRSIDNPQDFIYTNVVGTFVLLDCVRKYLIDSAKKINFFIFLLMKCLELWKKKAFLLNKHHMIQDLHIQPPKASSDHLCRAWYHTYNFPVLITNCGNNYGPFQSPEKLIPKTIINCINRNTIPIYGQGRNIRDWIHVDDHVSALIKISDNGSIGESYNIGSNNELTNNNIVHSICKVAQNILDSSFDYTSLIEYVDDRPGHDFRYAMDTSKINNELKWKNKIDFENGIYDTFLWYKDNQEWIMDCLNKSDVLKRQGLI